MWVDEEKQQQQQQHRSSSSSNNSKVVLPGEPLHLGEGFLLGLNTYVENGVARSSVCGVVQTVNRLVYVRALKSRYEANVGDVVVGRVTDIANGKVICGLIFSY
ncbi:exosome complex exonuclease, putative [Eimeria maxima]|uniref:Exosome complex exonuclease, putative n=1 Tax=Eimeria maxima TaxID=5804 RepID=U6M5Y2_EIMMA|nr:exosome complex exonuclease, putative [Eimeria maxima]CDJ57050.1 exosome complex exonuclease, putative [Eimeria maxima]